MADPWGPTNAPAQSNNADPWGPVAATHTRSSGATGFGMVGELFHDLTTANHPDHDPNSLERGIMDVSNSPFIRGPAAVFKQAVANGPIMTGIPDPTFALATAGVGRDKATAMGFKPTLVPGVRRVMENSGYGMGQLRAKFPGQSNAWYRSKLHEITNQALTNVRQQATNEANAARIPIGPNSTLPQRAARLGQQTLNLGANIVANPEYFAIPGLGVGGNVATRIGTSTLGNAAIGSVADSAAQVMDQAEGLKKDFDVQQNLNATITSGVFGGAVHSAIEVAPFVKSLFASRGVDTTPIHDPRTSPITPMTGNHAAINAADSIQYKQLLQHGSVDDIKGFFQGRNGPQPSWQEVNAWVEHRDGQHPVTVNGKPGGPNPEMQPDFDYEQAHNNQWREQNRAAVAEHVDRQMSDWRNAPEVETVHGPEDIADPTIREQALQDDPKGNALGFLGPDGKVRMFSGRITSPEAANAVLFHEGLGHHGLAIKFGQRLDQVLTSLLDRNIHQFGRDVKTWMKENPKAYGGDRLRAAEEVLAEASQKGRIKPSWQNALTSAVRQFGRKMGMKLSFDDAEVNHILAMSHDAVINGHPDAVSNGFRGVNKFMYIGQRASNLPKNAEGFVGPDGETRYEIGDENAKISPEWAALPAGKAFDFKNENASYRMGDVLDHPELYKHYPELADLKVTKNPAFLDFMQETQGWFDPKTQELNITPHSQDPKSTALHEMQHWIQHEEGWSAGGNPKSVPFNDVPSLQKLQDYYVRKNGEAATGYERAKLFDKYHQVKELEKDNESVSAAYHKATDLKKQHLESVRELKNFDIVSSKERQQQVDNYTTTGDRLRAELFETRWDDPKRDVIYKQMKENSYPTFDWEENTKQRNALKAKSDELYKQYNTAKTVVEKIEKKHEELSHDLYKLIAGEREARDTQARADLNPVERKFIPPYSHEGILDSEIIHIKGNSSDLKFMKSNQFGDDNPLPFTEDDVIMGRRLRGMIKHHDDPNGLNKFSDIDAIRDRAAREHGDVPDEIYENIQQAWRAGRKPELATSINVYDNRTGNFEYSFPNRRDAFEWIDKQTDPQHYGIDRLGTDNKYITRAQLEASSPGYKADDLEGIYNALDEGYIPTTRTWEEDRQAALKVGFTPSQIKALKALDPGELSTRLYRLQSAANMADAKIKELNKNLNTPDWTEKDRAEYIRTLADRNYFAVRIKGDRAEIARAHNIAKAAASYNVSTMDQMRELLEQHGSGLEGLAADPTAFFKFARSVKDLMDKDNIDGAHAKISAINKPHLEQWLTSFHYNAMLSGLSTHVKAPMDMMTGIAHSIIDHVLSMPIAKAYNVLEGLTGREVKSGVSATEVAARLYGITRAVFDHEVHVKTLEALRTGEGSAVLPNGGVIPTNPHHTYMGTANPRLPGPLSLPTDAIIAQDTFFRSVSVSESLYGMGIREAEAQLKASGSPYTRDDVFTLGATIAHEPTPTMIKEARAIAEKALLLNPNKLTSWIDKVKHIGPGASGVERLGSFIANNLAPFIRVAANSLLTRTIERSPLQLLSKQTRKTIMAGGPEAHLALARIAYGTVKLGLMWMAAGAAKDKLTGEGPDNANKRRELEAAGWRRNAVHENGRYNTGGTLAMSLNPFDMHNSTAQMITSMRQAYDKGANEGQIGTGIKLALGSILHSIESETWVDSVAPAVAAASADGGGGAKVNQFVTEEAKSWVPNILGQTSRITNPNRVDTRAETDKIDTTNVLGSAWNGIESAIPGLNSKLPTQYSVYGNPIPTGQSIVGQHTIIPGLGGNGVQETRNPAERELNRLAKLTESAIITPVQSSFKLNDEDLQDYLDSGHKNFKVDKDGNVKLTRVQFQEYQRVAGLNIVETVRQEMSTLEWQAMSDEEKVLEVRAIQTDIKKAAREAMLFPQ